MYTVNNPEERDLIFMFSCIFPVAIAMEKGLCESPANCESALLVAFSYIHIHLYWDSDDDIYPLNTI